ncbi:MAG: Lytic transglycosylase catalytic [Candidatus Gallionella acididurans]|uniref:Lytic transglycosylase catalytic n=1 Tax=Candidatus Gallionella acididurans TaxID=1796491 RepID=A0A139BUJ0_9PROT|nr:MAG: Lytic transglycosylase catalytic [Candidatus Gallionella acididurans]
MRFILYLLLLSAPPVLADQVTGMARRPDSGQDAQHDVTPPRTGDADFLAAHDAFLAGDRIKLGSYAQRLKNSPLEVYVSYYQSSLDLKYAADKPVLSSVEGPAPIPDSLEQTVKTFLSRPEDTPVIDQLRAEWLKLLGKNQQWVLFDAEYPHLLGQDTELTCYALQSRRRTQETAALRDARKLWFVGKGQPESCGALFDAALSAGIISKRDISQRLRLSLEANDVSFAINLVERLDGKHSSLPAMLRSASADPERYLSKLTPKNPDPANGAELAATQTRTGAAIEALISGNLQQPASGVLLESAASSPGAIPPSPSTGWLGWADFFSRLGWGTAVNPALPGSGTTPPAVPDIRHSGTYDAACDLPCADIGDPDANPPMGWNPKLASRDQRLVALFALERLAKQSPDIAAGHWAKIAGYFPVNEQHYFYGRLAYQAARNLDARALQWYRDAAGTPLDERQSAWRVRAALRAQDWPEVLASVNAMGEQQQRDGAWQYWKARALQALGKPVEARTIFASLSGDFNFYGQLANAELAGSPVLSETPSAYKPGPQALRDMLALPGIQRTLTLYRIGMRSEALDEWRWVLRNLNDRELLTAAEIARQNGMYDRAIGAADLTVSQHDFSLRYLAPYRADLQAHIREQGLDEAWVYGLMRQESRFATNAKSETGAAGLMQIMPGTARWAANKLGLKSYRKTLIHQLDTNLRLGTYYMKAILVQSENNPVLASAAYNAGPQRALQWRGNTPMEGAIYTETIPFEETRDYVKKVMSNTTYYANQFGDPPRSLKQRLGIVPAKAGKLKADAHVP